MIDVQYHRPHYLWQDPMEKMEYIMHHIKNKTSVWGMQDGWQFIYLGTNPHHSPKETQTRGAQMYRHGSRIEPKSSKIKGEWSLAMLVILSKLKQAIRVFSGTWALRPKEQLCLLLASSTMMLYIGTWTQGKSGSAHPCILCMPHHPL